ncbi:ABC transporter permease [Plantactinospora sp. CA-294935]|uniref:ABC transporter permease n=1 Tax=Plantactinospora sp. CA-294935 TaxID=3240012 RepID=UPI003D935E51
MSDTLTRSPGWPPRTPPRPGRLPGLLNRPARLLGRSPAVRVAIKRVLQAIPVVWGATFITFCLMNLLPGNAAVALLGDDATPEQVAALSARLNLDEPFLIRYLQWLGNALTGDLGNSLQNNEPVTTILGRALPVSLELVVLAFALALLVAVPTAVVAAKRPGGFADRIGMQISMFGLSVPNFVFALVLVLIFAVGLRVLPAVGYVPLGQGLGPNLRAMVLPATAIAFALFCEYTRVLRADIVDQMLREDYITTARAKGVGSWQVLIRHALRNSVFSLLTIVGLQFGALIGSTVIIEQMFGLPGMGQGLLQAINNRDVPVVQAYVVVMACFVVGANLVTDLLYAVLDPRIRHGRPAA